jgi:methionyl-tRNA formyltransferase
MRILFLGSGPFGAPALERLATLGADLVVGTVPGAPRGRHGTPEPTPIALLARDLGLELHETDSLRGARGPEFIARTRSDLAIVCDFRLMLGRRFLEAIPRGAWNLHGSLLPRHRGAAPVARAILAGDEEFGVTLVRMVLALDAGPIVAAARIRPEPGSDAVAIEAQLARLAADLLEEWLPVLAAGTAPLVEQDERGATYAPKLEKQEGWIDWTRAAPAIERQVRALRPWPRAFTEWGSEGGPGLPATSGGRGASVTAERVFIDCAIAERDRASAAAPGAVRAASAEGIRIACGDDGTETLRALELQRAGKRSLAAGEFLRGFPLAAGRFLPPRRETLR